MADFSRSSSKSRNNKNGEKYINSGCRRYICNNNQLTEEVNYICSNDAICEERDGVRRCYCNDGSEGDGVICTPKGKDCYEIYNTGVQADGVYTIYPTGWENNGFEVYCYEMSGTEGGWTVFQQRSSGSVDFFLGWNEYKIGFGNVIGEHWLGNDKIYDLTSQKTYQLSIELTDAGGTKYVTRYSTFSISDESENYRLSVGESIGNSPFGPFIEFSGRSFSTHDRDNDDSTAIHCANKHRGGWWYLTPTKTPYHNCYSWFESGEYHTCTFADLNGDYKFEDHRGIFWYLLPEPCGLTATRMSIRPE